MRHRRGTFQTLGQGIVMLAVLALGGILIGCPGPQEGGTSSAVRPADGGVRPGASQQVLQKIRDATVLVETELTLRDGSATMAGSGFVINGEGRIVTNAHVVSPEVELDDGTIAVAVSRAVRVIFHAGTDTEETVNAEVVRENSELDLALLKVDRATPVFFDLGDSDAIPETAKIIAAGHPLALREISLRTGTITAHRNFEGKTYLEHDAEADDGNSGGPIVDEQGRVVGVHTWTRVSRNMSTKWAIPSNVVRDWLQSNPRNDPPVYFASLTAGGAPIQGGSASTGGPLQGGSAVPAVEKLLEASGLIYEHVEGGVYEVPYTNDATVYVHEWDDLLRVYVVFGDMPDGAAFHALRFNYFDPVGRLSVNNEDGVDRLYWEAQVPMGMASPEYLRDLCDIAANQIENFALTLAGDKELETPTDLYPGGDPERDYAALKSLLDQSGLKYEIFDEENFKIPFDNDVIVWLMTFNGMAYVHSYTGGIPGDDLKEAERLALEMLRFNWDDPLGRVALDDDFDVVWEVQVPISYMTPDYLYILANVGSNQVEKFWEIFGRIPFNSERFGDS